MPQQAFKRTRTRQPQGAVRVNPRLNLVGLVLPGQSRVDRASGLSLSLVGGTPTATVGAYGPALLCDSAEYIAATATNAQRLTTEGSIVWVGELFSGASDDASIGGITHNDNNAPPYTTLEIKRSTSNLYLAFSYDNGANFSTPGTNALAVGTGTISIVVVGTYKSGQQRFYVRLSSGAVLSATSALTGSMASSATAQFSVGERLNARNPQCAAAAVGVANRAWSDSECRAILANAWGQLFAPRTLVLTSAATVQLLRPVSDVSAGAWTPSSGLTLAPMLNEAVANDTSFITVNSASTSEVAFGTGLSPGVTTGHTIRFRAQGSGGLTVRLMQGATVISSFSPTLTTAYALYTWTLSGAEAATISNYADLRLRFTST